MNIQFFSIFWLIVIACMAGCTGDDSGKKSQTWYKGNLHAHSFWSDGNDFPEMIMDWYKSHDYDFAVLSDHNILAKGDKWVTIAPEGVTGKAYQKYKNRFDSSWIETRRDTSGLQVRLKTLEEYRPEFEEQGEFLIIQSEEITDRYRDKPIHLNATNIQELIPPQGGNSVTEVMQNNIDAVLEQRKNTGEPMIPHINHPNFGWAITAEDMAKLDGERFFEVYNGHPSVNNFGDDSRPGTDAIWDEVLTAYLQDGKPPIYGLAVDDSHNYHEQTSTKSNPGRGWVMVNAPQLTPKSLINALESGQFYASSGVEMESIQRSGSTLEVTIKKEEGVDYRILFIGTRLEGDDPAVGKVLKEAKGTNASYTLGENDLYVRAKIISSKDKTNPYQKGEKEMAWIQPVIK